MTSAAPEVMASALPVAELAKVANAAEYVLRFLPREHAARCPEAYDRECGVCACGFEEAELLRQALRALHDRESEMALVRARGQMTRVTAATSEVDSAAMTTQRGFHEGFRGDLSNLTRLKPLAVQLMWTDPPPDEPIPAAMCETVLDGVRCKAYLRRRRGTGHGHRPIARPVWTVQLMVPAAVSTFLQDKPLAVGSKFVLYHRDQDWPMAEATILPDPLQDNERLRTVLGVLTEVDAEGLMNMGVPSDEYMSEAQTLLAMAEATGQVNADDVRAVWQCSFGCGESTDGTTRVWTIAMQPAFVRIATLLQERAPKDGWKPST
jgi:hypothetical protein